MYLNRVAVAKAFLWPNKVNPGVGLSFDDLIVYVISLPHDWNRYIHPYFEDIEVPELCQ